jgi:long-chain acyl-CoA synthetase
LLTGMLRRTVAANPAKTAVVHGERRLSYFELERAAGQYAGLLKHAGVGQGDTVAVVLPNCPEFVISFFAIARLHAVMLPLNPSYTPEELRRFLTDRPARIFIVDEKHELLCRAAENEAPVFVIEDGADFAEALVADIAFAGDALLLHTSGSTDSYKRVCCTQENLYFEAHNFVESTRINANDTILCTIPFYHSYGLGNCLLDAAYTGTTLVLEPDSTAPFVARYEKALELLRAEQVRVYPGVPFQFEVLATSTEDVGAAFRDVTWCISSGDVLSKRTFDRFLARTGQPIRSLYGSTEAGSISMDVGKASDVRFGTLGLPLKNVTVEVRGESGHIWIKSPVIPPCGYDNHPEINETVFRDGFYNTGDVGELDERGYLVMTGRKQSFFDVGGHKVDLAEVEEVLLGHAKVREAAVVGIEIPNLGGVIKAVVAAHEACRETDILDHCRKHLAVFKIPRFVEFRETLPRSPLGKVLRQELSDPASWGNEVPSVRELPDVSREQQIDWLAQRIQEQVATILRCEPSAIPRAVPFQSLGFDSLGAVELQERFSQMSGVALSITTLWNYTSIDAYATFLLDAMQGQVPPQRLRETDPLDHLTTNEIAAMLAKELDMTAQARNEP